MNLWVNRLRQLSVLTVALFFFSCEDENSFLGYKNPNTKFKNYYVEIPLGESSSVLLLDSVRTVNALTQNERNRLLVGRYDDPAFGTIQSNAIAEFFAVSAAKLPTGADVVYDSVSLHLSYDQFYTYGSPEAKSLKVSVFELGEQLDGETPRNLINRKETALASELGGKTFRVNPPALNELLEDDPDSVVTQVFRLSNEFGQRLFQNALRYRDATTKADSSFYYYTEFKKEFPGIALVTTEDPADNGIIVGFTTGSNSRLILHYHTSTREKQQIVYSLGSALSYNNIRSDRSSTELADLSSYFTPFYPSSNRRFVQAGTGITTKLDLSKFVEFAQLDSVQNIVINEAELVIGDVETSALAVPPAFTLRALKPNNRLRTVKSLRDTLTLRTNANPLSYLTVDYESPNANVFALIDADQAIYVLNDLNSGYALVYDEKEKQYSGFVTMLFQQLIREKDTDRLVKDFVLYPSDPNSRGLWAKSLNRASFPAEQIKVRIKYTKPTINQDE